mmetsp:Transcript_87826/g.120971  ORF Transcript_87826/g.120971 Transcript_87826/m.120971 type:complete len:106 (-) Transcript_87826:43-360(-)
MIENVTRGDFNNKISGLMYQQNDAKKLEEATLEGLKPIEKYLTGKRYLAGNNLTYVDFIFFEILDKCYWATNNKLTKDTYPNCTAYFKRVASKTGLKEYLVTGFE